MTYRKERGNCENELLVVHNPKTRPEVVGRVLHYILIQGKEFNPDVFGRELFHKLVELSGGIPTKSYFDAVVDTMSALYYADRGD